MKHVLAALSVAFGLLAILIVLPNYIETQTVMVFVLTFFTVKDLRALAMYGIMVNGVAM